MRLLIGAPVYKRNWILPYWFDAIEKQNYPLQDIGFVFQLSTGDDETLAYLMEWHEKHPDVSTFNILIDEKHNAREHPEGQRIWSGERYRAMVDYRNNLLDMAIALQPDRYFSLDTDILLADPETINKLVALTEEVPAAAPLMYMTPDSFSYPSVMSWSGKPGTKVHRKLKYPIGETFKADVIMAAKMMSKEVYSQTRYVWHSQGEDIGWSYDCHSKGFDLYSMSGTYCPHIMSRAMLKRYLVSGDRRAKEDFNIKLVQT